ncbi:FecR/PupR family sigma factor regulator [Sphingomonas sp. H39-1-10]|uniref:FecR/PupR family sigma factor regulator n=1 Tax=Sphingomonas pollutisoli TaxID=3030829 RepID=UPI0023B90C25|nr:FecR family protein [Sphingomonas pollutisoli]MDF0490372.1 FecR/PupR family sigma factor regulator [Sphingomonas pollutisoli]
MADRKTPTRAAPLAPAPPDLHGEALAWLNQLASGTASKADDERFLAWRSRSAAHEDAYRGAIRQRRLTVQVFQSDAAPSGPGTSESMGPDADSDPARPAGSDDDGGPSVLIMFIDNDPRISLHADDAAAWSALVAHVARDWRDIDPDEPPPNDEEECVRVYFDRPTYFYLIGKPEIEGDTP